MVIGYRVDEFTHTWSAEQFVAHFHIYPGFTGKVSSLTHFHLEPRVWGLFLFRPSYCWLWTRLGFLPHWFHWDASIGHILQSLLGFSTQLILFLIFLNHSLTLALGLVNCGARLGCFLHLCLWLPRCQHLNWFTTSLVTLHPMDSGLLHHQITTLSPCQQEGWSESVGFSDWHWCCCSCHSQCGAAHFSPQSYPCWYYFLSTQFWGRIYTCVWCAWITYRDLWHSGQCCVQMSWELHSYFSTCV